MTGEKRSYPRWIWVFLITALAGCLFGMAFGLYNALVVINSVNVPGTVARYTVGFGLAGVVTGLVAGLVVRTAGRKKDRG